MLHLNDYKHKRIVFIHSGQDHLRFGNENLILEEGKGGKIKNQMPCSKIFAVFVIGPVTITSHLLEKADRFGFSIILLKYSFRPYAFLGSQTEGNTLLKIKQYNLKSPYPLCAWLVRNKIHNQAEALRKIRKKSDKMKRAITRLEEIKTEIDPETEMDNAALLGREGNASKAYFGAFFEDLNWQARRPRVKQDPLNSLLDIGYTYMFNFVEAHLRLFGFDLYKGFYHRLFYQRKSLVCDLVEPFRPIVDSVIRKGFNLKQFRNRDFIKINEQYHLRKNKNRHYTMVLFNEISQYREDIFIYVREYYRAFIRGKAVSEFPPFLLGGQDADC